MSNRALALALLLLAAAPAAAEPSVVVLPLPFAVAEFRSPGSYAARVLPSFEAVRRRRPPGVDAYALAWGEGQAAGLYLSGGEVRALTFPLSSDEDEVAPFGETAREATPGTRSAQGGPVTAYLANPADAAPDGPLGEVPGSRELVVAERKPVPPGGGVQRVAVETVRVEAGPGAVFQDVEPRLADLDGDGAPEIIVVRQAADGARLSVVGRREGAWAILAETPPVEGPDPWLNPAAVAAFGRGRPEIALVKAPHGEGVLQVWAYEAGKLVLRREKAGFSTHALGSAALDLAASLDLDGDGAPDLVLPSLDRRSLVFLSLKDGVREIARVALPAPVSRGVAALGTGREARLLAVLEDGRVAVVRP